MINSKELIKQYGLTPNKALGQNFLIDEKSLSRIAELAECEHGSVLEIGPGLGVLTDMLCSIADKVVAVEIDKKMVELLDTTLAAHDNISITNSDILKLKNERIAEIMGGRFTVCANLPYYITSQTAMKLIDHPFKIDRMVLMMQQEAAEHFIAQPKQKCYTPISVLAQHYFNVREDIKLPPSCYYPEPGVHSTVLVFERKPIEHDKEYSRLVKQSFMMRRKTLRNNLSSIIPKEAIPQVLQASSISENARAEELTHEDFERLNRFIKAL